MHLFRLVHFLVILALVAKIHALRCFSCWKLDCRDSNMEQCAFMRNVTLEHENVTALTETLPQYLPACPTTDHDLRWNDKFYENCTKSSQACVTVVINLSGKIVREYIHVTPYDILAPPRYFHASIVIMGCAKGSWKDPRDSVTQSTSPTDLTSGPGTTTPPLVTPTPAVSLKPKGSSPPTVSQGPVHQNHSIPRHHKGPRQRGHGGKKHHKSGHHQNTTTAAPTERSYSSTLAMTVSTTAPPTTVSTTTIKATTTTAASDKGGSFAFLNPLINFFKHPAAANSSQPVEQGNESTTTTTTALPATQDQVKNESIKANVAKTRRRRNAGGIGSDAGTVLGPGGQPPVFSSETGIDKLPVNKNDTEKPDIAKTAPSTKSNVQVTTNKPITYESTTASSKTPVTLTTTLLSVTKGSTSGTPSTTSRMYESSTTSRGPAKTTAMKQATPVTTSWPQTNAPNDTKSNETDWLSYLNPLLDVLFGNGDFNDQIVMEDEVPQCPTSFEYKQNRTEVSGKRVAVLHLMADFSYCEKCSGNLCNVHIPYEKEKVLFPWFEQVNEIEEPKTTEAKKTDSHTTSRPSGESSGHFTPWVLVATAVLAMLSPNL